MDTNVNNSRTTALERTAAEATLLFLFSFTRMVSQLNQAQIIGLGAVPPGRILMETDSYNCKGSGVRDNTPAYIGEVAKEVAGLIPEHHEVIFRATLDSTRYRYSSGRTQLCSGFSLLWP